MTSIDGQSESSRPAARGKRDFPPLYSPEYEPTKERAPKRPLITPPDTLLSLEGPSGHHLALEPDADDADLTTNAGTGGLPLGERIVVEGRILSGEGEPVVGTLVEIWQANAAGRYGHKADQHSAPLDPNFVGMGHCYTDDSGVYRFITITPGAYPVPGTGVWRPRHIHFSVFAQTWRGRVVTQLYFPGDPLQEFDPIFQAIPKESRSRLMASYDPELNVDDWALGYRFDIVVDGPRSTPAEERAHEHE